ncbi:MarR family transcriptional regulator [Sphaerisporangium sp. TRM90804]|uniref:MarR family winged helix-turn-helix transcriptional regulator n=1 Tax=Sphaerisporangium sp. TRM90804 TaxID=3031113 RepID=UPI00244D3822|nr:MarR family transcriptional regulator [Sphaerisporangium sp. TRM90804]MDH2426181.1 MarR family transcriptional regulator [Sphaerisporangium sp. TRM90804]
MPHDEDIEVLEAVERETRALFAQADRLVRALAARVGMNADAFRCLSELSRRGPLSVRHLATVTGLTEEAAGRVVAALEADGLAERRPSPDGRAVAVHADPLAHRARTDPALRELREAWHPLVRRRCDDLELVAGLLSRSRRLTDLVDGWRT